MQECSICLEVIEENQASCTLSCNHVFHTSCMLNAAQYDLRCPMCRTLSENVLPRNENTTADIPILDLNSTILNTFMRERRNYRNKRNRTIRNDMQLKKMNDICKSIHKDLQYLDNQLTTTWNKKTKELWKMDTTIQEMRAEHEKKRRKYNRLSRKINKEVRDRIGEETYTFLI